MVIIITGTARSGFSPKLVSSGDSQLMVIFLLLRSSVFSVPRFFFIYYSAVTVESTWRNRAMKKNKNSFAGEDTKIRTSNEEGR